MSRPAARRPAAARRSRAAAGGLILLLVTVLAGCAGRGDASGSGNVTARVTLHPAPAIVGPARIELLLSDAANAPVSGASVEVEGTMSHAGMAPVVGDAVEAAAGQYTVDDFAFTMAGDWTLIVRGRTSAGDSFSTQVDLGTVRVDPLTPDGPLIPSERCYATPTPTAGD